MPHSRTNVKCFYCGETFSKETRYVTRSKKLNKQNFCNRTCSSRYTLKNNPELQSNITPGSSTDEYSPFRKYLSSIKSRSKDCTISLKDLKTLWDSQQGKCAISGIEMTIIPNSIRGQKHQPFNASLDRINSSVGYTRDNIQWVCLIANYAKNTFTTEDVIKFCKATATLRR